MTARMHFKMDTNFISLNVCVWNRIRQIRLRWSSHHRPWFHSVSLTCNSVKLVLNRMKSLTFPSGRLSTVRLRSTVHWQAVCARSLIGTSVNQKKKKKIIPRHFATWSGLRSKSTIKSFTSNIMWFTMLNFGWLSVACIRVTGFMWQSRLLLFLLELDFVPAPVVDPCHFGVHSCERTSNILLHSRCNVPRCSLSRLSPSSYRYTVPCFATQFAYLSRTFRMRFERKTNKQLHRVPSHFFFA